VKACDSIVTFLSLKATFDALYRPALFKGHAKQLSRLIQSNGCLNKKPQWNGIVLIALLQVC